MTRPFNMPERKSPRHMSWCRQLGIPFFCHDTCTVFEIPGAASTCNTQAICPPAIGSGITTPCGESACIHGGGIATLSEFRGLPSCSDSADDRIAAGDRSSKERGAGRLNDGRSDRPEGGCATSSRHLYPVDREKASATASELATPECDHATGSGRYIRK